MGPEQSDHALASLPGKGWMTVQLSARGHGGLLSL